MHDRAPRNYAEQRALLDASLDNIPCAAYFDFVSPIGDDRGGFGPVTPNRRVDRIDCRLDPGHDGPHQADSPEHVGPGTVTWG